MMLSSKYFPFINHKYIYCDKSNENLSNYNFRFYKNIVVVGIGANIKDCIKTFDLLFLAIRKNLNICLHSTSLIYKNKAFGHTNQPDFYNSSIIFLTNMCLREVFTYIFYLERKFNRPRKRDFKNSPRTLDIDLIFFNNIKVNYNHLTLPHKGYKNRMSVLLPLQIQFNFLINKEVA